MADNIRAIQTGRLSLSRVTYHTNLQQAAGLVIPLGVIAEMTIGTWRALGLIARTSLAEDEAGAIGRLLRDKLSDPFNFLKPEFDWAFSNTEPNEALEKLAQRFSKSLFFAPPAVTAARKVLPIGGAGAELVLTDLRKSRDEDFYLMLAESRGQPDPVPSEDTTKFKLAA